MIYLLLGSNDYEKQQFIGALAKRFGMDPVWHDASSLPEIDFLVAGDLFSKPSLHIISESIFKLPTDELFARGEHAANTIVLMEEKLDKRKKETKTILEDKRITVREFVTPEGQALMSWIDQQAAAFGLVWNDELKQLFIKKVVGQQVSNSFSSEPSYSLWQLHHELAKLKSYSAVHMLNADALDALLTQRNTTEVWDIVNAVAERRTGMVPSLIESFFSRAEGSDEKTKTIQLSALLAEQLRSIALVQSAGVERISDADILSRTGWKSGRLFMVRKAAQKFNPKIVHSSLSKLASLDLELKNTATPPRVLLDMILMQMM